MLVLLDLVLSFRNPAKISARRIADYTYGARSLLVELRRKEDPREGTSDHGNVPGHAAPALLDWLIITILTPKFQRLSFLDEVKFSTIY